MNAEQSDLAAEIGTDPGVDVTGDASDNESYHGYSVDDETQPQSTGDSLVDDRGLSEPLDEGYSPPETWSAAQGFGNTPLEGALEDRQAYVGADPLLLGHTSEGLRAFGVDESAITRLDEALVRAAIGQDADLVPLHAPVGLLPDGVGAALRFDSRPERTST